MVIDVEVDVGWGESLLFWVVEVEGSFVVFGVVMSCVCRIGKCMFKKENV